MGEKRKRSQVPHGGAKRVAKRQLFRPQASMAAVMRKGEIKAVDIARSSAALNTTVTFNLLNAIVPGSNQWNRIGRKVLMKSLTFNYAIQDTETPATAVPSNQLRALIVYDRQPNAAAPTYADIIQTVTAAGGTASDVMGFPNLSNQHRFKIIRDYQWKFGPSLAQAPALTGFPDHEYTGHKSPLQQVDYIPLNLLEHFNTGTAGTVADITTGSLYLVTLGLSVAADDSISITYSARVRYYDV